MSSKLPLSRLFFEISSQNSAPSRFNQIQNEYINYVNQYPNNSYRNIKNYSKSPQHEIHKNRIMNELNFVYDRVNTNDPKSAVSNDDLFPTQIHKTIDQEQIPRVKRKGKANHSDDEDLDGIGYIIPRFPKKQVIVLKGKNKLNKNKHGIFANEFKLELEKGINNDGTKKIQKDYDVFILSNKAHERQRPPIKFK